MPTLPTMTVTQAQADRLLAAFPAEGGKTSSQVYLDWLKAHLIQRVLTVEAVAIDTQHQADKEAALSAVRAQLP